MCFISYVITFCQVKSIWCLKKSDDDLYIFENKGKNGSNTKIHPSPVVSLRMLDDTAYKDSIKVSFLLRKTSNITTNDRVLKFDLRDNSTLTLAWSKHNSTTDSFPDPNDFDSLKSFITTVAVACVPANQSTLQRFLVPQTSQDFTGNLEVILILTH